MGNWNQIRECMKDSGCSDAAIQRAESFFRYGASEDLVRCLRSCRCDALEEIHEKQKQLDRLDLLIHQVKKN